MFQESFHVPFVFLAFCMIFIFVYKETAAPRRAHQEFLKGPLRITAGQGRSRSCAEVKNFFVQENIGFKIKARKLNGLPVVDSPTK